MVWDRRMGDNFGNNWFDAAKQVQLTPGGDLLVAGTSATSTPPFENIWLLLLGPEGTLDWDTTFGGPAVDRTEAMIPVTGGGYLLAGASSDSNDALLMRLSPTGSTGGCLAVGPGAPNSWTSPLTIATSKVTPTPVSLAPVASTATPVPQPISGGLVCSPGEGPDPEVTRRRTAPGVEPSASARPCAERLKGLRNTRPCRHPRASEPRRTRIRTLRRPK